MDDVTWDIYNPQNINKRRAENQLGIVQGGRALTQLILGEVVGGTVESIGSLIDAPLKWMGVEEDKFGNDYQNAMSKGGSWLRNWTKDALPIHKRNPLAKVDMADPGWWWDGSVTVGSAISMMIPGYGVMRAVAGGTRLARTFAGARALTSTGRASKMYSKAEKLLTGNAFTQLAGKSVVMGVASRHMENFREAGETYKVALDKNLEFLHKGTNYEAFLNSPEGTKFNQDFGYKKGDTAKPEAIANYLAGNAAAKAYTSNWGNVVFDITIRSPIKRSTSTWYKRRRNWIAFKKSKRCFLCYYGGGRSTGEGYESLAELYTTCIKLGSMVLLRGDGRTVEFYFYGRRYT